ncbi:MAG: ATP-binding protein [bacterium]|nr:ATP-binding protein [bacterium]
MKFIRRQSKNIEKFAREGKVLVVYGPRQAGKTTLLRDYFDAYSGKKVWLQGDDRIAAKELSSRTIGRVSPILNNAKLVIIDEAQYLEEPGLTLKFLVDTYKDAIFIVTGSSAFGLAHHTTEPLTGRASYLNLYPLDMHEIDLTLGRVMTLSVVHDVLVYGNYPAIRKENDTKLKEIMMRDITQAYLYKDILEFEGVRNHEGIRSVLKMLALQIGHDVSINEIATRVQLSRTTVEKYIGILEKSFIIASSTSVNTENERNEIGKNKRYYFVDLGIRNAVVSNFAQIENRTDIGQLWENFVFIERLKKYRHENESVDMCFWRTYSGSEVDIVERKSEYINAFECKWQDSKVNALTREAFAKRFKNLGIKVINKDTWPEYLL